MLYVFVRLSENLSANEYRRNDVREKEKKKGRLAVSFVLFSVFFFQLSTCSCSSFGTANDQAISFSVETRDRSHTHTQYEYSRFKYIRMD